MTTAKADTTGKNRTWIYLVIAFAALAVVGILTS